MPLNSMDQLFLNELKDVYNAEKQLAARAAPDGQGGRFAELSKPSRSTCGRPRAM